MATPSWFSNSSGRAKRKSSVGSKNMLSSVEDKSPNRITIAMGVRISLPGASPRNASGTSASPEASAVMRIGDSRSRAPRRTASRKSRTPSKRSKWRTWATIMIPLRAAMPNTVMKPISVATDSTSSEIHTPNTPPTKASGRLSITKATSRAERKVAYSRNAIATTISALSTSRRRVVPAALSN